MKYRVIGVAALALLVAACGPGNVYKMTTQEAYDKLVAGPVDHTPNGPFGVHQVSAGGDGSTTIHWAALEGSGTPLCEANLTPEGTDQTKVMVYCGAGGEGAAAGMTQNMYRNAMIEHIDATLKGRAFDYSAARGSTASSWPNDPRQADASMAGAAVDALKMEHEMRQDMKNAEHDMDQDRQEQEAKRRAAGDPNVNFKPGEPMVDPSRSH
jgi:hypothetical protein